MYETVYRHKTIGLKNLRSNLLFYDVCTGVFLSSTKIIVLASEKVRF